MRFVRFRKGNNQPQLGWVLENSSGLKIGLVEGSPFSEFRRLEATMPIESVELLAPVLPSKIICIGRNYVAHALEHQAEVPEIPLMFLKPPSTVIGPGKAIILPPQSQQVEHEAELAVVIAKQCRWVPPEEAQSYILGYTIGNDVTARDLQKRDGQWTRAKGFDTFCPLGPWVETEFDPADSLITCNVNDELRQMASTRDMVFSVRQLVAFASSVMTLEEGDILMTGTPSGVSTLAVGDRVEITIEGIGSLKNPVIAEPAR